MFNRRPSIDLLRSTADRRKSTSRRGSTSEPEEGSNSNDQSSLGPSAPLQGINPYGSELARLFAGNSSNRPAVSEWGIAGGGEDDEEVSYFGIETSLGSGSGGGGSASASSKNKRKGQDLESERKKTLKQGEKDVKDVKAKDSSLGKPQNPQQTSDEKDVCVRHPSTIKSNTLKVLDRGLLLFPIPIYYDGIGTKWNWDERLEFLEKIDFNQRFVNTGKTTLFRPFPNIFPRYFLTPPIFSMVKQPNGNIVPVSAALIPFTFQRDDFVNFAFGRHSRKISIPKENTSTNLIDMDFVFAHHVENFFKYCLRGENALPSSYYLDKCISCPFPSSLSVSASSASDQLSLAEQLVLLTSLKDSFAKLEGKGKTNTSRARKEYSDTYNSILLLENEINHKQLYQTLHNLAKSMSEQNCWYQTRQGISYYVKDGSEFNTIQKKLGSALDLNTIVPVAKEIVKPLDKNAHIYLLPITYLNDLFGLVSDLVKNRQLEFKSDLTKGIFERLHLYNKTRIIQNDWDESFVRYLTSAPEANILSHTLYTTDAKVNPELQIFAITAKLTNQNDRYVYLPTRESLFPLSNNSYKRRDELALKLYSINGEVQEEEKKNPSKGPSLSSLQVEKEKDKQSSLSASLSLDESGADDETGDDENKNQRKGKNDLIDLTGIDDETDEKEKGKQKSSNTEESKAKALGISIEDYRAVQFNERVAENLRKFAQIERKLDTAKIFDEFNQLLLDGNIIHPTNRLDVSLPECVHFAPGSFQRIPITRLKIAPLGTTAATRSTALPPQEIKKVALSELPIDTANQIDTDNLPKLLSTYRNMLQEKADRNPKSVYDQLLSKKRFNINFHEYCLKTVFYTVEKSLEWIMMGMYPAELEFPSASASGSDRKDEKADISKGNISRQKNVFYRHIHWEEMPESEQEKIDFIPMLVKYNGVTEFEHNPFEGEPLHNLKRFLAHRTNYNTKYLNSSQPVASFVGYQEISETKVENFKIQILKSKKHFQDMRELGQLNAKPLNEITDAEALRANAFAGAGGGHYGGILLYKRQAYFWDPLFILSDQPDSSGYVGEVKMLWTRYIDPEMKRYAQSNPSLGLSVKDFQLQFIEYHIQLDGWSCGLWNVWFVTHFYENLIAIEAVKKLQEKKSGSGAGSGSGGGGGSGSGSGSRESKNYPLQAFINKNVNEKVVFKTKRENERLYNLLNLPNYLYIFDDSGVLSVNTLEEIKQSALRESDGQWFYYVTADARDFSKTGRSSQIKDGRLDGIQDSMTGHALHCQYSFIPDDFNDFDDTFESPVRGHPQGGSGTHSFVFQDYGPYDFERKAPMPKFPVGFVNDERNMCVSAGYLFQPETIGTTVGKTSIGIYPRTSSEYSQIGTFPVWTTLQEQRKLQQREVQDQTNTRRFLFEEFLAERLQRLQDFFFARTYRYFGTHLPLDVRFPRHGTNCSFYIQRDNITDCKAELIVSAANSDYKCITPSSKEIERAFGIANWERETRNVLKDTGPLEAGNIFIMNANATMRRHTDTKHIKYIMNAVAPSNGDYKVLVALVDNIVKRAMQSDMKCSSIAIPALACDEAHSTPPLDNKAHAIEIVIHFLSVALEKYDKPDHLQQVKLTKIFFVSQNTEEIDLWRYFLSLHQ